jgi:hypothetical protein
MSSFFPLSSNTTTFPASLRCSFATDVMMRLCVKEATMGISARAMNGSLAMYRGRFPFIAENACENDVYAPWRTLWKPHNRDFELNKCLQPNNRNFWKVTTLLSEKIHLRAALYQAVTYYREGRTKLIIITNFILFTDFAFIAFSISLYNM